VADNTQQDSAPTDTAGSDRTTRDLVRVDVASTDAAGELDGASTQNTGTLSRDASSRLMMTVGTGLSCAQVDPRLTTMALPLVLLTGGRLRRSREPRRSK